MRVAAGWALAGLAHACSDVSDGLLADLAHVCTASGVGAEVQVDALPCSAALAALACDVQQRRAWQASGGDDYELCFTAAAGARDDVQRRLSAVGVAATCIGRIVAGQGVRVLDREGQAWQASQVGYRHFIG